MTDRSRGIARRDFVLLPLVGVLTVLVMLGVAEITTRIIWNSHEENSCVVSDGSAEGYHLKPNCTSLEKNPEGPWARYHFNECGYRSNTSCGPVSAGTLRIAVIGASVSQGMYVPYEDTFFALSANDLRRICNRAVDVQNLGKPRSSPLNAYRHLDEALALKPDVIVWLLAPFDLEQQIDPQALADRNKTEQPAKASDVHESLSLMRRIQLLVTSSRTVLVAEHFLLQNRDTFLRLYLNYGDKADFLRQPFTAAWEQRFSDIDAIIADTAAKARAAGAAFVVIPVPSRAEAALLNSAHRPAHVDPFAFGRRLEQIAAAHGAGYVDLMEPFSRIPDAENLFLIVDGHVAAGGQKVIAAGLTHKLLDGSIPAFAQCAAQNPLPQSH
jgi:hypothetical protein